MNSLDPRRVFNVLSGLPNRPLPGPLLINGATISAGMTTPLLVARVNALSSDAICWQNSSGVDIGNLAVDSGGNGLLQVKDSGATSRVALGVAGGLAQITLTNSSSSAFIVTPAAATIQFGSVDVAAPIAQTLGCQNVVAGTSNTNAPTFTIRCPAGTGTGLGGNIVFQYAPHGSTGSAQNAWATALTINGDTAAATFVGNVTAAIVGPATGGQLRFWGTGTCMQNPSDGIITFLDNNGTSFNRLQLGGTTSSYPAIKRNGAAINFRLADDSADAAITASGITFNGGSLFNAYNEGTFTPTDNSGASLTFSGVNFFYRRIGNTYRFWGELTYPSTASGAGAALAGFPFTAKAIGFAVAGYYTQVQFTNGNFGGGTDFRFFIANQNTTTAIFRNNGGTASNNVDFSTWRMYISANTPI